MIDKSLESFRSDLKRKVSSGAKGGRQRLHEPDCRARPLRRPARHGRDAAPAFCFAAVFRRYGRRTAGPRRVDCDETPQGAASKRAVELHYIAGAMMRGRLCGSPASPKETQQMMRPDHIFAIMTIMKYGSLALAMIFASKIAAFAFTQM